MFLSHLSVGSRTGEGGSRTGALPGTGHSSTNCSHPLAVSSIQSEPEGDGTALPSGDSLYSMWVFGARRESHGPSTLGLHLCLKGTARRVPRSETETCLQKGLGVIQVELGGWVLCQGAQSPELKRKDDWSEASWFGEGTAGYQEGQPAILPTAA